MAGNRIKGSWSPDEDAQLTKLVEKHGPRNWSLISSGIPGRSGKSCRLRWCNQLSPSVQHRPFSPAEDEIIVAAHATHGNKWATISRLLPGRTDNAVKNHWNSTLRRRIAESSSARSFDTDPESDSDSVRKRRKAGISPELSDEASVDPITSLSLSPPGVSLPEPDSTATPAQKVGMETKDMCFMMMMQEMIAREVRSYINRARIQGELELPSGEVKEK